MKAIKVRLAALATFFLLGTMGTMAADLGGSLKDGGWRTSDRCFVMRRSPILDLRSASEMRSEVERRYEHSLEVSETKRVIYSRRPVFPWAVEAKAACGVAIGYFKGREVNEEAISKCDCFYGRMMSHYGGY